MGKNNNKKPAMPKRPRQHELDTESIDYIKSKLPTSWTREEINNDYGKDLFIEIFENGEATALEFRIQAKGHENFIIRHGDMIIQNLKVSTLNYYDQSPLPILLVTYSAKKIQACYLWIKSYINEVLDKERPKWRKLKGDSNISIRIPLRNNFDDTSHSHILDYVESEISKIRQVGMGNSLYLNNQSTKLMGSIASTRLIRPKVKKHLHRPQLTELLSAELEQKTVFIHSDAGFGKTWLIQDFLNATDNKVAIWYTLTKDSLDAATFIQELASEMSRKTGSIGSNTLRLIAGKGQDVSSDNMLAVLVDEVSSSRSMILLIVEDLHNVVDNSIYSVILSFIRTRPENLHIILTSRLPLPSEQTKLVAQNNLVIVGRSKLEFQLEEVSNYLKLIMGLELSQEQLELLYDRTEGWVAALSLANDVLQNAPIRREDIFNRLSGFEGNIYGFFAEEVYQSLNTENKALLRRLSIVDGIRPDIVNLYTRRSDGGQILRDLVDHNTFLIEDQGRSEHYRLHTLFAEFLWQRLQDEDGDEEIRKWHGVLAEYYSQNQSWYKAVDNALLANDYQIAVKGLELLGPTGVSLGYGMLFLSQVKRLPDEWRSNSRLLLKLTGLAELQVGELDAAYEDLAQAKSLYELVNEDVELNEIEFLLAEVGLAGGTLSSEDFVTIAKNVALKSYLLKEILFGIQVELRLIQVGQALSINNDSFLLELLSRNKVLIERAETLGENYGHIKARAIASSAHLNFQKLTYAYSNGISKVQMREKLGHPIPMNDRVYEVKQILESYKESMRLYDEAENLVKDDNEIEWASIRTEHLSDFVHHLSLTFIYGSTTGLKSPSQIINDDPQTKQLLYAVLIDFDRCASIFGKYHLMHLLASLLCDGASVYDVLGDTEKRDSLANKVLDIATKHNFSEMIRKARDILSNRKTFTALFADSANYNKDEFLANLDDDAKALYVNSVLQALDGNTENTNTRRDAVVVDVNDMVSSAKQRIEWCKHIQLIQDLEHTKSLDTMYKQMPEKRIVCNLLRYQSPSSGSTFDEIWPLFKGVFCLSCTRREL